MSTWNGCKLYFFYVHKKCSCYQKYQVIHTRLAGTRCILASRWRGDDLLKFKRSILLGNKVDLSDFAVGRSYRGQTGWAAGIPTCSHLPGLQRMVRKKKKNPDSNSLMDETASFLSQVREEWGDWFKISLVKKRAWDREKEWKKGKKREWKIVKKRAKQNREQKI